MNSELNIKIKAVPAEELATAYEINQLINKNITSNSLITRFKTTSGEQIYIDTASDNLIQISINT